jgi:hypothetical protein
LVNLFEFNGKIKKKDACLKHPVSCSISVPICQFKFNLWTPEHYTGRFIMYSRITEIYYRKTIGHVFTKPVQIEGTTQKIFSQ